MGVADCSIQAGLVKIPQKSFKRQFSSLHARHTASRCLYFPTLSDAYLCHRHVLPLQFLPVGQYGLCFGYFVSGPLLQRSHYRQAIFYGVRSGSP